MNHMQEPENKSTEKTNVGVPAWSIQLSDTFAVTGLATVTFLFGKIYYTGLIRGLHLEPAMFDIPIYDVMFASSNIMIILALLLWILATFDGLKPMVLLVVVFFVKLVALPRLLVPVRLREGMMTRAKARAERIGDLLDRAIPKFLNEEMQKIGPERIYPYFRGLAIIVALVIGVDGAQSSARHEVEALENEKEPRVVSLFDNEKNIIVERVRLIRAIGDGVVVDDSPDGNLRRHVFREKDVREIVRFLPEKAPSKPDHLLRGSGATKK